MEDPAHDTLLGYSRRRYAVKKVLRVRIKNTQFDTPGLEAAISSKGNPQVPTRGNTRA